MAKTERRVALVTGGAKRVGKAIVQRLADAGYAVAFTYYRSGVEAQDFATELRDAGRDARPIPADLVHPGPAIDVISRHLADFTAGRLDLLVHNASLYETSDPEHVSDEQIRRLNAIHIEAPLLLTRTLAPDLRAAKGSVITMLDIAAERPFPKYTAYCASKAALWNLTLSLARELAPDVTVNGIAPGVVDWPDDMPQAERDEYLKKVPLRRAGSPADVASLVHYLATEGRYITGQVIRLDGGRSIAW